MEPNVNAEVSTKKPSLFGMITSPGVQFERMKHSNAVWGAFFLVMLFTGIAAAVSTYVGKDNPEIVAAKQSLPEEIRTSLMVDIITAGIVGPLGVALVLLIGAGIYKVVMMFMGNDTSYKKLLTISVYVSMITVLGMFVNAILVLIIGSEQLSYTSLVGLFEAKSLAAAIMGNFEIFGLWGTVLTYFGLHITAGLSKKQAVIVVIIFFLLGIGMTVGFHSLGSLIPGA